MRSPFRRPARPRGPCHGGRPRWSVRHTSARDALQHRRTSCTTRGIGSAPPPARAPSTAAAGAPG
eukprot:1804443-Rhodomonas_salina.1